MENKNAFSVDVIRKQNNDTSLKKPDYVAFSKQNRLRSTIEPAYENQNDKEY